MVYQTVEPEMSLFTCITCRVAFADADLQRAHYKTDWHRYNLKRKVAELPPVTADNFQQRVLAQRAQVRTSHNAGIRNVPHVVKVSGDNDLCAEKRQQHTFLCKLWSCKFTSLICYSSRTKGQTYSASGVLCTIIFFHYHFFHHHFFQCP